jgi:hypothetical protein
MSFGRQSSTQSSGLDPAFRDAFFNNLNRSSGVANQLSAREFADFTGDQQAGFDIARQFASPTSAGMQNVASGSSAIQSTLGYQPTMVGGQQAARAGVQNLQAQSGAQNMQQYMNPFQQDVVDVALGDIERSRQMQQMQGSAQAQRAGAFGGSRQGVAEALTNEAALREAGRTSAQLRSQGFETAAGLGMQDAARQLQAQSANQGVDMSLEQANAQLRQQADFANQQAGLQGAQQRIQAGSQLADVGALTQNLGFTQAAQLGQVGQQQQALSQAQMDAIRNLPLEQQQIINEALGLNPGGGAGATSSGRSSGFNIGLTG